jgi:hypothetical protein
MAAASHCACARVRAAFLAAALRREGPFVLTAFFADCERADGDRRDAADFPCCESDRRETADCPSRFNAPRVACERRADGRLALVRRPRALSLRALRRVLSDVVSGRGGRNGTPARRALDSPMAMACFGDRAPCLPSRTCSISSRTYSPACVDGAFPSALSRWARCRVLFSGMAVSLSWRPPSGRTRVNRRARLAPIRSADRSSRERALLSSGPFQLDGAWRDRHFSLDPQACTSRRFQPARSVATAPSSRMSIRGAP